ncbi:MAG TPA: hypothetical protein VF637_04275, partial [Sphingomicrobium sp.]
MSAKAKLFWSASLLGVVALATPAAAQQSPASEGAPATEVESGPATNVQAEEGEIVVTGLRASL